MIQSHESAERIRELLDRNLQEVFGEGDNDRRRAAIGELWAEDGVLYDPPGAIISHDAIDKFAGDLRATHFPFELERKSQRLMALAPKSSKCWATFVLEGIGQ
ncbi:nuclear transport factor 2 family protein [Agrobacterium tumefaciens]|uniref:nuclear transport factor 2 family protein n=1 Tax=Agrobacterium tumefaciens TaxID=358 RepID=UPI002FDC1D86